jgi:hypothetical protein
LRDAISNSQVVSSKLDRLRPATSKFFSAKAASWMAESALRDGKPILDVLAQYGVATDAALARATLETAARQWVALLCKQHVVSPGAIALLEYGLRTLLQTEVIQSVVLRECATSVIAWVPENDEQATTIAREWLLSDTRFGDPRLPTNQPNWASMPSTARDRILRWLAKGDLVFFFDFVMSANRNPHGRKQFWLKYIDQVTDVAVALSPADALRLRLAVTQKLRYAHASSPASDVSAFVMRFRGTREFVVAEFSQSGNAAYIHDAEKFDQLVGGMRARSYSVSTNKNGLKSPWSMLSKYSHTDRWQSNVANVLAAHGIRRRTL